MCSKQLKSLQLDYLSRRNPVDFLIHQGSPKILNENEIDIAYFLLTGGAERPYIWVYSVYPSKGRVIQEKKGFIIQRLKSNQKFGVKKKSSQTHRK